MAQGRRRQAAHIVNGHIEPAAQQRQRPRTEEQGLGAARAAAITHVLTNHVRGQIRFGVGGRDERGRVPDDGGRGWNLPGVGVHRQQCAGVGHALGVCGFVARGLIENDRQRLGIREPDVQFEHEAIELGFWQRIGALHVDRVLGRQDEKRGLHLVGPPQHGDRALLHGFEQSRLGLGGSAVDLVGQHDVGEDRAGLKTEGAPARLLFFQNIGPDNVGRHQVRRELDA